MRTSLGQRNKPLDATPRQHLTFLTTEYGRPFTEAGFGNWFRDRCNEAGLKNCSAHGLRKASAKHLAECGATTLEIMSITGHRSLAEVERYTREAGQKTLVSVREHIESDESFVIQG